MNILIDSTIFKMQAQGGISRLWRSLLPELSKALPEATFDASQPPDIFISTYYQPAPLGVRSMALVYDLIVDQYPLLAHRADCADIHRAINEASILISISQATAAAVKAKFGRDSIVAYPGVDTDFAKVESADVERFTDYIGKPYILVVGKRGLYKNVQALYQAWPSYAWHEDCALLCIGGEDILPQDKTFIDKYPNTWLRMNLSDGDLPLAYVGARALVYPSLMEGFGLPLAEAMASGCPIVCDRAMAEATGGAAYYADVTKPKAIAEALHALADPSDRAGKVLRGFDRAKQFRWGTMAQVIADAIRKAYGL